MTSNLPTLPAGWELKKLGDVVTEISSKIQAQQCQYLPYLSLENIESQTGKLLNVSTAKESNVIGTCSKFTKDTVIYSKLRPYLNKVAIPDFDGVGTTELIVFQPKDNLDKFFLANYLRSESVVNIINASSYGAKMPRTSSKFLKELEIPLPPLNEQKRLVSLLDTLFAKIDRSIELLSENIAAADALLPSALNTVFGEMENEPKQCLKDITSKIGSGATPSGGEKSYKESGISLIRSMNVHDYGFRDKNLAFIDDQQAQKLNNVVVEDNDVLLNITGASVARCCIVDSQYLPARVNQHVAIIRLKKEVLPQYVHYYLISPNTKNNLLFNAGGGATREAITKKMIEEFEIPLPPLDIQTQTVAYLDSVRTKVEILKQVQNDKITHLKALKASILDRAFKGEL